ncbi:hypothetical protein GQR58_026331 [Nymphon striatum]|nr:hypothetical protein GQR58_026331 [Nymphon striatum]
MECSTYEERLFLTAFSAIRMKKKKLCSAGCVLDSPYITLYIFNGIDTARAYLLLFLVISITFVSRSIFENFSVTSRPVLTNDPSKCFYGNYTFSMTLGYKRVQINFLMTPHPKIDYYDSKYVIQNDLLYLISRYFPIWPLEYCVNAFSMTLASSKTFMNTQSNYPILQKREATFFFEICPELITLGTGECASDSAIDQLRILESTVKQQYSTVVQEVLIDSSRSIHVPLKKSFLHVFKEKKHRQATENKSTLEKKSDILKYLQNSTPTVIAPPNSFDCTIFDGAAVMHALQPNMSTITFDEYANKIFVPYLRHQLKVSNAIHVVWDTYLEDRLKETTREKRGAGVRTKVSAEISIPNWKTFLRHSKNKTTLFSFFSKKVFESEFAHPGVVFITYGEEVLNVGGNRNMSTCSHVEADTRMVVHLFDALETDSRVIQIYARLIATS